MIAGRMEKFSDKNLNKGLNLEQLELQLLNYSYKVTVAVTQLQLHCYITELPEL